MLLKSLKNQRFSRWSGPLIGLSVGAYCGVQNPFVPGALPVWVTVAGGALIGGFAGVLVMFLDPLSPRLTTEEQIDQPAGRCKATSSLVGRVVSLFGLLLCWIPFLGFSLNLIGVLVNRSADDWAIVISKIGLAIGLTVSIIMLVGLALGW